MTQTDPEREDARVNTLRAQQDKLAFLEALARREHLPWYANPPADTAARVKTLEDKFNKSVIHRFDETIETNLKIFYQMDKMPGVIEQLEVCAPDSKSEILKEIHRYGYVCKEALASILNARPTLINEIMDELLAGNWVKYLGPITHGIYQAFHDKDFFTVTDKDITEICPGIKRFNFECSSYSDEAGYFVQPGERERECERDSNGKRQLRFRCRHDPVRVPVPIHLVEAHLAAAFLASVINEEPVVGRGIFTPTIGLKRMSPMPDGMVCLSGGTGSRLAFKACDKRRRRACERSLMEPESGALPTVYIALTQELTVTLGRAAEGQKNGAVVMYGAKDGCREAYKGLLAGRSWHPSGRYTAGANAGYLKII